MLSLLWTLAVPARAGQGGLPSAEGMSGLFSRSNLVAWCIVPFDAKKRGPEERAAMLERLGFSLFAYDYRAEHIPTFDAEMAALKRHNIKLLAWWFPTTLNEEARLILDLLKRHQLHPQLWVTGGGEPTGTAAARRARIQLEAERIGPIARAAAEQDCVVALYNHGAWFGDPDNQIAIIELLQEKGIHNVGLVYNQHHGHADIDRFAGLIQKMKPHLLALNLNGMSRGAETHGQQILPVGQGSLDAKLLGIIRDSGWRGPIGLLNHTDADAELRLKENLAGLDRLVAGLD